MKEKLPQGGLIRVSLPLEEAILISQRDLAGKPLDVPQLMLAIFTHEGLGKRSMEVVSKSFVSSQALVDSLRKRSEPTENSGKVIINGQEISVTSSVATLLESANTLAQGDFVDTGHIIQAEINRLDSVLNDLLDPRRKSRKPIGTVLDTFIKRARTEKIYTQEPASTNTIQTEGAEIEANGIVDLIENAKKIDTSSVFVNPEWTHELIQTISSNRLTIVMSEHGEDVSMAIQGLAVALADPSSGYKDIPKIIVPDTSALIEDPEGVLLRAIRESEGGGVLVLPDNPDYITDKNVRIALERRRIKVITYAEEKAWNKMKGLLGQVNAHPLFLSSPSEEVILSSLKTQKPLLETKLNEGSNKIRIKVSEEALKIAAKLGYRYAAVMEVSSTIAAQKLLETAATNLKLMLTGMDRFVPFKIKKDESIDEEDVYAALTTLTKIQLTPENPEKFVEMEKILAEDIVGQDDVLYEVSEVIRRSETPLKDPRRPKGVFMFLGPSGVGKTELTIFLSRFVFEDEEAYIPLDMSEYMEKNAAQRLIGAPPGFVGYEEGGQLTEAVRKRPYSLVVFDELEKAHKEVTNMLLQVTDAGRLTDGKGRKVDFRDTVLVVTGNIGSSLFREYDTRGFEAIKADVIKELKKTYRPEFINRFDAILVFKPLSKEALTKIVNLRIKDVNKKLADSKITVEISDAMHKFLEKVGYDPEFGARPLKRAVGAYIENEISKRFLKREFKAGDALFVDYTGTEVVITKKK